MPRRARIVIPGIPHHVTQRGNHKARVFFSDEDFALLHDLLCEYSIKHELKFASFCFMPNHTHLIVVPETEVSLHRALKPVHMRYSQHLNKRKGNFGLNWQGRFFSSPMDEKHTWTAFQYVSLNPVKGELVRSVEDYRWSSAAAHLNLKPSPLLNADKKLLDMAHNAVSEVHLRGIPSDYESRAESIERNVKMNLPVGSEEFIEGLEERTDRDLVYRGRGRPRGRVKG